MIEQIRLDTTYIAKIFQINKDQTNKLRITCIDSVLDLRILTYKNCQGEFLRTGVLLPNLQGRENAGSKVASMNHANQRSNWNWTFIEEEILEALTLVG